LAPGEIVAGEKGGQGRETNKAKEEVRANWAPCSKNGGKGGARSGQGKFNQRKDCKEDCVAIGEFPSGD